MNKSIIWWIIGLVIVAVVIIIAVKSMDTDSEPLSTDNNATTTQKSTNQTYQLPSENKVNETVFSIAANLSGSSQFAALLLNTGVGVSVGTTTYTVFVPTDTAWNKAPKSEVSGLTIAEKKRLAQYHVIVGRAVDADALKYGTIQAMSRDDLNFSVGADKNPNVNSSNIIRQYKAKNGIVYVIDSVLLPPLKK